MSTLLTPAVITKESYCLFENNLVLGRSISWDFSSKFEQDAKIGTDVTVRRRINKITRRNDPAWSASNGQVVETAVKLVLDREYNTNISFTDAELALKVENFSKSILAPVISNMASTADSDIAALLTNCLSGGSTLNLSGGISNTVQGNNAVGASYAVGAYGTAITPSLVTYAHKVLQDMGMPEDGELYGVLSTSHNRQLVLAQASLFNTLNIIDAEYKKGLIGKYDGIEFSMSQSLVRHTNGAQATLVVSATATADGTSWNETETLTVTSTGAALKAGDVFQVNDVYLVNPLTKQVTDTPAQFTVLANTNSGATSVVVYPAAIYTASDYQNISGTIVGKTLQLTGSVLPEANAVGSSAINLGGVESLVFHKSAIQAASPSLYVPTKGVEMASEIRDPDNEGFKFRMVKAWDNFGVSTTGGFGTGRAGSGTRIDGVAGFKVVAPYAIRIRG